MIYPARILVVDDEVNIRLTLEALLRRTGFDVVTAADGDEAIMLIEQQAFELLLVDLKMPGKDGKAVVAIARERQPTMRVIVLTGHGSFEDMSEEELRAGVFDYMLKTADPAQIIERVKDAVAVHAQQPGT